MQRVLFLCQGNSARSQMAEALLNLYGDGIFEAYSAGVEPAGLHPMAIEAMAAIDIDITQQSSNAVDEFMGYDFDYLITLCNEALPLVDQFSFGEHLHWPFENPSLFDGDHFARLAKYHEVRDSIWDTVREWVFSMQDAA